MLDNSTQPENALVTCFDVLLDLGDPLGAAAHIHRSPKPDGTGMLMEPLAARRRKTISGRSDASPMRFRPWLA
jgi:hypothetical protein